MIVIIIAGMQDSKRVRLISAQLKEKVRKKPFTQRIEGKEYTYSLLKKKCETFFLTNQRLLLLKGSDSIGYARNIPEDTILPFKEDRNVPQLKCEVNVNGISNVFAYDELLIVEFRPELDMKKWEFICDTSEIAWHWKAAIVEARRVFELESMNEPMVVTIPEEKLSNISSAIFNNNRPPGSPSSKNLQLSSHTQSAYVTDNKVVEINAINHLGNLAADNQHSNNNDMLNRMLTFSPKQSKEMAESNQMEMIGNALEEEYKKDSVHSPKNKGDNLRMNYNVLADENKTNETPNFQNYFNDNNIPQVVTEQSLQRTTRSLLKEEQAKYFRESVNNPIPDKLNHECHWDYQFLKGESQYIVIEQFKQYIEELSRKVVDEMALKVALRQFKTVEQAPGYFKYHIGNVSLEIVLLELSEVKSFQSGSVTIDPVKAKYAKNMFKNANYVLQCTRNRGRFVVPLMMLTYYKGFQILATSDIHTTQQFDAPVQSIQQDAVQLQQQTKIGRGLFDDEDNLKVVAAENRWFQKMGRNNLGRRDFQCCFLTGINHFLPQDFHGIGREGSQQYQLRPELLQDQQYTGILFSGNDLISVVNKSKITPQIKKDINILGEVGASIPNRIATLAQDLQNLDEWFTNSEQLAALMHSSGVNMRYLGLLLEKVKEPWLKALISSQIVSRSAKYYFRFDMQESATNLNVESLERARQFQKGQVIGWLNRLFGAGTQSDSLWREIVRQAQIYFKAAVSRQNLNIGFLLQGLQYHCGFRVNLLSKKTSLFKSNTNFLKSDFIQFTIKSSVFDPSFTDHYKNIENKLEVLSLDNFQSLANMLNIDGGKSIDTHYSLNGIDKEIVTYLANWLSPSQNKHIYNNTYQILPSKYAYQLQLVSIKWELKAGQIEKAQSIRDKLVSHLNQWLGDSHPLLTQLFDLFARYYLSFHDQHQLALNYSKSALVNQEKLLGSNHFRLADAYYALGDVQLHFCKKFQALGSFRKALQIIGHNNRGQSQAFVEAGLRVAELCLSSNSVGEARQVAQSVLVASQNLDIKDGYLSASQILARCFEVTQSWQDYFNLVYQLLSVVSFYTDSVSNLQRILKLIVFPSVYDLAGRSKDSSGFLLQILRNFSQRGNEQNEAFIFLKGKINEQTFPLPFLQYIDTFEQMILDGQIRGLAKHWRGFEMMGGSTKGVTFLRQLQAVRCIISKNFMEGILCED